MSGEAPGSAASRKRAESGLDPFYPIVDSAEWVARLVRVGAKFIQLRIKDKDEAAVARETRMALAACKAPGASLVVNDYWRVAIDEGAPWLHLGQGDLDDADVLAVRKAGIKLGISTHDDAELVRALTFAPDYVALGPIYPTKLKAMAVAPQGLEKIGVWKRRIAAHSAGRDRWTERRAGETVPRRWRRHRVRRHRHHAQR